MSHYSLSINGQTYSVEVAADLSPCCGSYAMDGSESEVLAAMLGWAAQGQGFALVTLARAWGSAPRPPGAWLALRVDGVVQGSVSGGCIEDDLIARMLGGRLGGDRPFRLDYGVSQAAAGRHGLPCGGTLELVVEPAPDLALLAELARRIAAGQRVYRTVRLNGAAVGLEPLEPAAASAPLGPGTGTEWDGETLRTLHGPRWRLILIGAGQVSGYLARMAQALDYEVTVCDPREAYHRAWQVPGVPWLPGMPDDVVRALSPDPHTAIVALTHDPRLDDLALVEALRSPACYVGALGSRANSAARRTRLHQSCGLSPEAVGRLHAPVGLPIGSRTPPEIAVAILAELIAVRRGAGPREGPASDGD